ncbi:hypothetical protein D9M72_480530 [compost metagenome]
MLSTVAPGSNWTCTLAGVAAQPVRSMLNGVLPAVLPVALSVLAATVGKVTMMSLLPPLITQVWPVISPLKEMFPSAAEADCERASAPVKATAAMKWVRISSELLKTWVWMLCARGLSSEALSRRCSCAGRVGVRSIYERHVSRRHTRLESRDIPMTCGHSKVN